MPLGDPPNDTYHSTERHTYVLQGWKLALTNKIMRRQSSETIVVIVPGLFFTRLRLFTLYYEIHRYRHPNKLAIR